MNDDKKGYPSATQLAQMLDGLQAGSLIQAAQIDNILTLLELFGKHLGVEVIEGLSIRDWFQKEKEDQVERILIHFEDQDPGVAAFLQQIVDRRRARNEQPPEQKE